MTKATVNKILNFFDIVAAYCGLHLLRKRQIGDSPMSKYLRKIIFGFIIFIYCLGFVLVGFICVPIPENEIVTIVLDTYFAFPLSCGAFFFSGFTCFIGLNYITNYFFDINLKNECLRMLHTFRPPDRSIINLFKRLIYFTLIVFCVSLVLISEVPLMVLSILEIPMRIERLSYWLSLPMWYTWTTLIAMSILSALHYFYHCALFYIYCGLILLSFRAYCDKLRNEKAADFTKSRIILYHREYCRLIGFVENLDHAFKICCLIHVFIVIFTTCFFLFLFAKGAVQWFALMFIAGTLCCLILLFFCVAIPAVMLNNQVS